MMGNKIRSVLVAGDFSWPIYEPDFCAGLRQTGVVVSEFRALRYLGPGALLRRAQGKFLVGPGIAIANLALMERCRHLRPDVLLAWRTPWLAPVTIRLCQRLGVRVVIYNNDDPFGPDANLRIWRRFRAILSFADACFAYREVNLEDYRQAGARRVGLLRSWFNPAVHHPVELSTANQAKYGSDVVFVGHGENDGRLDLLVQLADSGVKLRLFGPGWTRLLQGTVLERLLPVASLDGSDYTQAIAAAKIALVFLSARNRDQYTRRCFEIPAIGTLMLAPRTQELAGLFAEDREAVYYSSAQELVDKAKRYCLDEQLRSRVASAGRARCLRDGHDVASRATTFIHDLAQILSTSA